MTSPNANTLAMRKGVSHDHEKGWTGCHDCLGLFFSGWPPPTPDEPYNPAPNGSCRLPLKAVEGPTYLMSTGHSS
jgi:hypothetical protein